MVTEWPVGVYPPRRRRSPPHARMYGRLTFQPACVSRGLNKGLSCVCVTYYLRSISIGESLAYPPRLAVDLGSYVDGEAHGWARQPYGYFDPAPRPRDIIHTY